MGKQKCIDSDVLVLFDVDGIGPQKILIAFMPMMETLLIALPHRPRCGALSFEIWKR